MWKHGIIFVNFKGTFPPNMYFKEKHIKNSD